MNSANDWEFFLLLKMIKYVWQYVLTKYLNNIHNTANTF